MAQPTNRESSSTSSTEHSAARRLRIGRVGRARGTGGQFAVVEPTRRLELLAVGSLVQVGPTQTRIVARAGTGERPVIGIEGIVDRAGVGSIRGAEITVGRVALGELEAGEYLVDDLIGLAVTDGERSVGSVIDVMLLPAVDVLEVRRPDGTSLLVPLIRDAVRSIDVEQRRIDIVGQFLGEVS
ncbi:MAG: ribosome maturation factor RimM [Solirubrobacterales bacterium]